MLRSRSSLYAAFARPLLKVNGQPFQFQVAGRYFKALRPNTETSSGDTAGGVLIRHLGQISGKFRIAFRTRPLTRINLTPGEHGSMEPERTPTNWTRTTPVVDAPPGERALPGLWSIWRVVGELGFTTLSVRAV